MATEPRQAGQEANATFCNWHPETETRLHCSHCGKGICTLCLVQVPVGIRCRECGRPERIPTYDVQPTYLLRAVGVGIAIALFGGILWGVVYNALFGIPFVSVLLAAGVGFGASELIGLSVNKKRGNSLAWVAGSAVGVAGLIQLVFFGPFTLFGLLAVALGVFVAVVRMR